MSAAELRMRRRAPSDDDDVAATAHRTKAPSRHPQHPHHQPQQQRRRKRKSKTLTFYRAFFVIVIARTASAVINLVHDCDETFNFWEPLHYLVHGHGLQTWEHSPEFALRSYLYLGLHWMVAKPISLVTGNAQGKLLTFIGVRLFLGMASAASEAWLCVEVSRLNAFAGAMLTALLAWSAGLFAAGTAFLPSSFAMYCVTTAAAAALARRHFASCAACVVAVVWGWPFAGIAAIPFGLDSLAHVGFVKTAIYIAVTLVFAAGSSVAVDSYFYGRVTSSTLNILRYNVGGGGSELYGVESRTFYLRNLFNGFNLALPLALAAPLFVLASSAAAFTGSSGSGSGGGGSGSSSSSSSSGGFRRLLVAYSPFPLALVFFSSVAHKEERFMYIVYPLLCLGAAITLAAGVDIAANMRKTLGLRGITLFAALSAAAVSAAVLALSVSRVAALTHGYGAPMAIYPSLPVPVIPKSSSKMGGGGDGDGSPFTIGVCVGGEWYRFPSSFHLPSPAYRLLFVESTFDGALPVPFDAAAGGTRYAPAGLNDENRGDARQRAVNPWGGRGRGREEDGGGGGGGGGEGECHFVVDVDLKGVAPVIDASKVVNRKPPNFRNKNNGKKKKNVNDRAWSSDDEDEEEEDEKERFDTDEGDDEAAAASTSAAGAGGSYKWEVVREVEFLDQANSPSLSRAFFVPGWSYRKNTYGSYRVLRRVVPRPSPHTTAAAAAAAAGSSKKN